MNPYYTHQETLNNILSSFDYSKPVHCLEFGTGDGSSSIFHKFLSIHPNLIVESFEHDESWLNNMSEKYKIQNYSFNTVDWENFDYEPLKTKKYDLIFVDQGDWDARIVTIDELKKHSKYIILHDYCYYNNFRGGMTPTSDMDYNNFGKGSFFEKYNIDFDITSSTELFPPTLILKSKI